MQNQIVYHELRKDDVREIEGLRESGLYSRLDSLRMRGLEDYKI